jgi:site-specific recombinase XerD
MLTIYRRHRKGCKFADDRISKKCHCPLWATNTLEGAAYRRSLKTRNWERADQIVRNVESGSKPKLVAPTITEAVAQFTQDAEHGRKLSPATLKKYRVVLGQLEEFAAAKTVLRIDEVTVSFAREFRASWKDGAISSSKKLERLKAFFRFHVAAGWLQKNPAQAIAMPTLRQVPTLPFTKKEMESILKAATEPRWHALIQVLRWSGLRIGDAMKLTADKLQGSKLLLRTAKTGVNVFIPLPDFVVAELEALPKYGGYFFWKREGESKIDTAAGNARRSLREIFTDAGVKGGHPHRFRDNFSIGLLESGVPLETVAALLGHSDPRITARHYSPWVQSRQDILEKSVAAAWPKSQLAIVKSNAPSS